MSVRRTEYGTWEVRWRDGNRHRSKSFRTKTLAERHDRNMRDETERHLVGIPAPRRRLTVDQWTDEWLAGAHTLTTSTKRIYREGLDNLLPHIGDVMLDELDKAEIDKAFTEYRGTITRLRRPPAASSLHRSYRAVRRMLRVAVTSGLLDRSPMTAVDPPRVTRDPKRYLTAEELERLASAIDARYRTLVLVGGWGGLRWGELAGLRHADVDHDTNQVHVMSQKTSKPHQVDLPASIVAELPTNYLDVKAFVWTMPDDGPLDHARFRQRFWVPAIHAAGVAPLHPHNLRDTAVALMVAAGAHPAEIQAQLGHDSIQTTFDQYGGLFEGATRQVAGRLDELRRKTV